MKTYFRIFTTVGGKNKEGYFVQTFYGSWQRVVKKLCKGLI